MTSSGDPWRNASYAKRMQAFAEQLRAREPCPCRYCEHNRNGRCECGPCVWIRREFDDEAMIRAGHDPRN